MRHDLIQNIHSAFENVESPPEWRLITSHEGDEPLLLEAEFKGKTDWKALDPAFLDQAPDGLATALALFSDEAFRFYLPAYLIADIQNQLKEVNMIFHLTHGLDNDSRTQPINSRRYGARTWYDDKIHRFSIFSRQQCQVILEFLEFKMNDAKTMNFEIDQIRQALQNYWQKRTKRT